jgi:type VI protein secretion system component Hcp
MYAHRLVTVIVLSLALVVTASAQQQLTENFDGGNVQDWELHDGAKVVAEQGMGKVLQFKPAGFAMWDADTGNTFTLQMSVKVQQEGMFGVIFRNSGEPPNHNEYQLIYEGGDLHVIKIANGQESEIATGQGGIAPNMWTPVTLQINGGRMTVQADNQQVLTANDQQPLAPGGFALHGANVSFDKLSLTGSGAGPATQPAGGGGGGGQTPLPESGGGGGASYYSASGGGIPDLAPNTTGIFLKLEGIKGTCTNAKLKDWIVCTDWAFGLGDESPRQVPGSGEVTVAKRISIASPGLWQSAVTDRMPFHGMLYVVTDGQVGVALEMKGIQVVRVSRALGDAWGNQMGAGLETVTLTAEQIRWIVPEYDEKGKRKGSYQGGYNYGTGVAQ